MASISSRTFTVRAAHGSEAVARAARRVIVNAELLKGARLCAGDVVALSAADTHTKAFAVGIVWPSLELSQDSVLASSPLLLTAQVPDGSRVRIFPLSTARPPPGLPSLRQAQEAHLVRLREVPLPDAERAIPGSSSSVESGKGKRRDWLTLSVREALVDLKYLAPTQTVDVVYEGRTRRFTVSSVSVSGEAGGKAEKDLAATLQTLALDASPQLWTVGWDTTVVVETHDQAEKTPAANESDVQTLEHTDRADAYASVGGLDKQIAQIRDLIEIPLTRPELFRHFGLKPPRGILLHGPPGTGKTHLARAIAASTNAAVLVVNGPELSSAYHGETEARLRDVFADARARSPCIVVLDEVDALCPRREEGPGGEVEKRVVAQLLTIMDGMADEGKEAQGRVVVVATTNRPNAIDPALRRPGRFDREIEIGIPDAEARISILNVLLKKTPHEISQDDLRSVAARAHGYVGADLSAVVREAGTLAIKRWLASSSPSGPAPVLTLPDLVAALTSVRPSALRSLFLDTAPVRWADIGGQAAVAQRLRECVEWPLLHPEAFARLGVRAPKGVLLYGPPGCSKTLLVRACATESGVNFLAVKGPELLNKFVGESERAVREIFRKARAAAPSLLFFDEIDALATSRSSSDSSGGVHEGVLTSLLNEMDGVQELVGVTIVAATNRPDVIDSALMRPGRLDRILYVGPPDKQGREEILRIQTRKMSVEPGLDYARLAEMTDGCSGAEMTSLCQEAALLTMKKDVNAPYVPHEAFIAAARAIKKQITPEVVEQYEQWRNDHGVTDA
ncbi:AAA family ATPase [Obba rivulosa]|uniref:AAA family ATPase n=1 Tax=Obba rivulosa TaxID=1052685 RepID=A0A8E2DMF2_9APHY|nr:AAA family ATPase [Obba rivulosa]